MVGQEWFTQITVKLRSKPYQGQLWMTTKSTETYLILKSQRLDLESDTTTHHKTFSVAKAPMYVHSSICLLPKPLRQLKINHFIPPNCHPQQQLIHFEDTYDKEI